MPRYTIKLRVFSQSWKMLQPGWLLLNPAIIVFREGRIHFFTVQLLLFHIALVPHLRHQPVATSQACRWVKMKIQGQHLKQSWKYSKSYSFIFTRATTENMGHIHWRRRLWQTTSTSLSQMPSNKIYILIYAFQSCKIVLTFQTLVKFILI